MKQSIPLLFLPIIACADSPAAPQPTVSMLICDASSHWIAYQNDGGPWTYLGAQGLHGFMATPRLAIARARFQSLPTGTGSRIFVDYLTAEQANDLFGCSPGGPSAPSGFLAGSIAGAADAFYAQVYFNGIGAHMADDLSTWTMEAQPVPATLLAARYDEVANEMFADRLIIRRDQSYLPGTPVPLLDFASDEAFAPQVDSVALSEPASVSVWYYTGDREHFLSSVPRSGDAALSEPIYSIPVARMADGDIHVMTVLGTDNRGASRYFRVGQDMTIGFGPSLYPATINTVARQPYRRMRVTLPSQPEYGASVEFHLAQLTPNYDRSSEITLGATREYFGGTPALWALEVPDFSTVEGFQLVGMFADGPFSWFVRASNARFGLSRANANDGETVLSAFRAIHEP